MKLSASRRQRPSPSTTRRPFDQTSPTTQRGHRFTRSQSVQSAAANQPVGGRGEARQPRPSSCRHGRKRVPAYFFPRVPASLNRRPGLAPDDERPPRTAWRTGTKTATADKRRFKAPRHPNVNPLIIFRARGTKGGSRCAVGPGEDDAPAEYYFRGRGLNREQTMRPLSTFGGVDGPPNETPNKCPMNKSVHF